MNLPSSRAEATDVDFAFITCAKYPDLIPDDNLLLTALRNKGYSCRAVVWHDAGIDWGSVRVVLLRSAWDYHMRFAEFCQWLEMVSSQALLINHIDLLRWNIDKRYLQELGDRGFSVIPTVFLERRKPVTISALMEERGWPDIIVKPSVGLSGYGVKQIIRTPESLLEGQKHIDDLPAQADVLVQPYLPSVIGYGERSLVFFGGEFSHCVKKMRFPTSAPHPPETLVEPNNFELTLGNEIIKNIFPKPVYARVDLLALEDNQPCLVELELIDPVLFFRCYAPAIENFASKLILCHEQALRR